MDDVDLAEETGLGDVELGGQVAQLVPGHAAGLRLPLQPRAPGLRQLQILVAVVSQPAVDMIAGGIEPAQILMDSRMRAPVWIKGLLHAQPDRAPHSPGFPSFSAAGRRRSAGAPMTACW